MRRSLYLLALSWTLASPVLSKADFIVGAGYELFHTDTGTSVGGIPFEGVPLGSFDFGGGPVAVGNTDTIVQRIDPAVAPGGVPGVAPAIRIEMVALQLMSTVPADFGLGLGTYFMTLQSARGGPQSVGSMTITFGPEGIPHGTFDSFINLAFDIRLGGLAGPIALSNTSPLTATGVPWDHFPPPTALLISGVNYLLNGIDQAQDFWPGVGAAGAPVSAPFTETGPGPPQIVHVIEVTGGLAAVPEPASLILAGVGLVGLVGYGWRRPKRVA